VKHFHDEMLPANLSYLGYGMTRGALYVPLMEGQSNIWLAKPVDKERE
jgi:hypothetical protein